MHTNTVGVFTGPRMVKVQRNFCGWVRDSQLDSNMPVYETYPHVVI